MMRELVRECSLEENDAEIIEVEKPEEPILLGPRPKLELPYIELGPPELRDSLLLLLLEPSGWLLEPLKLLDPLLDKPLGLDLPPPNPLLPKEPSLALGLLVSSDPP
jgi:hypothetical protein